MKRPLLIVVSAPSGAGKTTLCDMLLKDYTELVYSISCTTRQPRPSENDGEDYYFLSREDFESKVESEDFLEYAEVHGNMYGTLKDTVISSLNKGVSVLMDIDVQGAAQIRDYTASLPDDDRLKKALVDIFITAPSIEALRRRLVDRDEDELEVINKRINAAAQEMSCTEEYMYVIVNDELERAYGELRSVIDAESKKDLVAAL